METVVIMDKHLTKDAMDVISRLGPLNERFSGKKILLTGGAGFLGSQFIYYFAVLNDNEILTNPCHVYAWDNLLRSLPPWLENVGGRSDTTLENRDITKEGDFVDCDYIIHAASVASPTYYRRFPIETMDANVIGLRNLLDRYLNQPIESLLYFSTSEIYGDPHSDSIPTPEDYRGNVSCTGPRACYDESKRFGETLCVNFWKVHGTPIKIVRPFNNYGPGLKITDRRVIPDFFQSVLSNQRIVLMSDGSPTRTFCYISDAMEGYLRVLLSDRNGESYNIGVQSPEINMRDLAETVLDISGATTTLAYARSEDAEYLTDSPNRRCPSIAKAQQDLGFEPRVSLREGLERTYDFYLDHPTGTES